MPFRELAALPHLKAQIVKGALEAEGFRVVLQRDSLGAIYALDRGRFATRLLVPEEDLVRARALLDEIENSPEV